MARNLEPVDRCESLVTPECIPIPESDWKVGLKINSKTTYENFDLIFFLNLLSLLLNEKKTNVFCVSVLIMGIGIIGSNWSVNEHTADFLAFANMEALARGESGSGITCWRTVSMNGAGRPAHYTYCGSCDAVLAREVADKDYCPR